MITVGSNGEILYFEIKKSPIFRFVLNFVRF